MGCWKKTWAGLLNWWLTWAHLQTVVRPGRVSELLSGPGESLNCSQAWAGLKTVENWWQTWATLHKCCQTWAAQETAD